MSLSRQILIKQSVLILLWLKNEWRELEHFYFKIEGDINVKGQYCAFKLVFIAFFKRDRIGFVFMAAQWAWACLNTKQT